LQELSASNEENPDCSDIELIQHINVDVNRLIRLLNGLCLPYIIVFILFIQWRRSNQGTVPAVVWRDYENFIWDSCITATLWTRNMPYASHMHYLHETACWI